MIQGRDAVYFFLAVLRPLPRPLAAMAKSSIFLPDLIAAASQRGFNPRPAQVSAEFSGLQYLGATEPYLTRPPVGFFPCPYPPSFDSSPSRAWRCSDTLTASIASTSPFSFTSLSIDIVFSATR